tara:strand:- start:79 stop:789 length:711 start_codon:yes stop_codon:yes gene_type:complete
MKTTNRAVILAGGFGKRLMPFTIRLPKPMVPIKNIPIIKILIDQLIKHKFNHITICLGYQSHIIEEYFKKLQLNIKIDFTFEKKPLGTIGPLTLIKNLPDNFLLMNGDILTDLNYSKIFNKHILNKNLFTINTFQRSQYVDFGVIKTNKNNIVSNFLEKPTNNYMVSMGIYFLNKKLLNYIPHNKFYGFDNLVLDLIKKRKNINTEIHKGYWLDIGRPDDYERANKEFNKIKKQIL